MAEFDVIVRGGPIIGAAESCAFNVAICIGCIRANGADLGSAAGVIA
jgi:hypothetical protein